MSRRLLGYVVKLPSGEWHDGKSYADKDFDGYPWTKDAKKRRVFAEYQDACRYVLTYVPENRLRIVPVYSRPKPAPADGAAEGLPPLFVVLHGHRGSFDQLYIGGSVVVTDRRAEAERRASEWKGDGVAMACQVFAVGAHEAAIEAARREERARVLAEVESYAARAAKRIAQADPHSWAGGRSGAFAEIAELARNEAAKGQAK